MRTLIYARYSSDLQNNRSIDDQIALCVQRAEREGWPVVECYTDAAISGVAGMDERQRPGIRAMLQRIELGGIDQVLAESTSRLARDEVDSLVLRRQLKFHGVRLFTLSDGEIDHFRGNVRALIDAQQRIDTAANVRRGQRGTVTSGRVAAGLAYGYRLDNRVRADGSLERGLRAIDEDKAAIVLRIFTQYAAGISPYEIALRLNAESIPSPSGGKWTPSTILGDSKRGNGILKNALYNGHIIQNRTRKVMHPETRRELIRPNASEDHYHGEAAHLRIIDDALWNKVQAELDRRSIGPITHQRRPKRLLSGLVRCGLCGERFIIVDTDIWGCTGVENAKGCTNKGRIGNKRIESLVLAGLQQELVDPDAVEAYVAEYAASRRQRASQLARERSRLETVVAEKSARVERLIEAIAKGADEFEEVRQMIRRARTERDEAAEDLATVVRIEPLVLHPLIARDYRKQIAMLSDALSDDKGREHAGAQIRPLIGTVTAMPHPSGRGIAVTVEAHITNVLRLATGEAAEQPEMTEKITRRAKTG